MELRLLGPPSINIGGQSIKLHSIKELGLLTYLLLERDIPHSREKLADLLWGESPEDRARQSLRQALYSLRHTLTSDCFLVSNDSVRFQPTPELWVDDLEFTALTKPISQDIVQLRHAVQLYRGLLLEGLNLSGCPSFEEWLFFERDALEQQAGG